MIGHGLLILTLLAALATRALAIQCEFVSTIGLSFGTYDVFTSASSDTVGRITYRCTNVSAGEIVRIDLSKGIATSYAPRTMTMESDALGYNLYLDAARVFVWGDGTGGTSTYGPLTPPDGVNVTVTIYGRAQSRQDVSVGNYGDTITAVMTF